MDWERERSSKSSLLYSLTYVSLFREGKQGRLATHWNFVTGAFTDLLKMESRHPGLIQDVISCKLINPDLGSTSQAPLERKQFRMQARIPSPRENSQEDSAGRTGEMAQSISAKFHLAQFQRGFFFFNVQLDIWTRSLRSLVSHRVEHSKRNSISTRAHVFSSICAHCPAS